MPPADKSATSVGLIAAVDGAVLLISCIPGRWEAFVFGRGSLLYTFLLSLSFGFMHPSEG